MKLWMAVVAALFAAWGLAVALSLTLGGAIHVLPAVAFLIIARRAMIGRAPSSTSYARWLASKGADADAGDRR